ncbi:MAG TPA: 23S rRNA (adenine(2503)-C(2))-methyltransferase RlmN [Tepidisphaeraceae bacterium]|jgi:23S rRNA (adenine2503-C2)-methyltransferase|nr:23S rRNA (adenine(2503)-C(2))-methyltransferase RlmN [Tepidisphaeraceae bacterium]
MKTFVDHDVESFAAELNERGFKGVHARKALRAFYRGEEWPGGPRLVKWLEEMARNRLARVAHVHDSADGTKKLLLAYAGGGSTEAVLMPAEHREDRAACCVSSQIGCAMGCDFCASTKSGLERNLSAGEIVEQFVHLKAQAGKMERRITSLVFMGMGEPMHNLENVMGAIRRIGHADLGGLGWRQITVSTVGIVPGIRALAAADLNVHLAVSLHAPDDQTRAKIIPANRRYKVAEVMQAAREFEQKTGRIVTIEYTLLAGVNDSPEQAEALAGLLEGFRAHVNLIPYNPIGGAGVSGVVYLRPGEKRILNFLDILRTRRVVSHIRVTRGDDVAAACGQLRRSLV